jgi:uncharacterized protein
MMERSASRTVDPGAAAAFLKERRLAVVGASDSAGNFARTVLGALRDRGVDVVAVHPSGRPVDGTVCYGSLAEVPGTLDGVIVMVAPERAVEVVGDCAEHGVPRVWLFKGLGGVGAATDDVVELARELGLEVIAGACPIMFLEPVGWFHRVHRSARRANGSLAKAG